MRRPRANKPKAPPKPRNVAARALRLGQFQPKVEKDPKAYTRKPKHKQPLVSDEGSGGDDPSPGTGRGRAAAPVETENG